MSKLIKVSAIVTLVLSFCFLCIGYANYQDLLGVNGYLNYEYQYNTLLKGDLANESLTISSITAKNEGTTITRIVVDSYNAQKTVIEAKDLVWSDGEDISSAQDGSIRRFAIDETEYILGAESSIVSFHENSSELFAGLSDIVSIEFRSADFSLVKDLSSAFQDCTSLETLSLSEQNLSRVQNLSNAFFGCTSLREADLSGTGITTALQNTSGMFENCVNLETVNFTNVSMNGVVTASSMFRRCEKLVEIKGDQYLGMAAVRDFTDMFAYCKSLPTLSCAYWASSSALKTNGMFGGCYSLTELDLYGLSASSAVDISYMFSDRGSREGDVSEGTMSLETVYVSLQWNVNSASSHQSVFTGTEDIVGGEGFAFNGTVDKTYAVIDKLSVHGYLTLSERDWGTLFSIVYHSFDDAGEDMVYLTTEVYENRETIIEAMPEDKSDLSFLGWSPNGVWISDEDSQFYPTVDSQIPNLTSPKYCPEKRILHSTNDIRTGAQLALSFGAYDMVYEASKEMGEIHLYDLYEEHYFTINGNGLDYPACSFRMQTVSGGNPAKTEQLFLRHYFHKDVLPETGSDPTIFYPYFIPHYTLKSLKTHYVHPGLWVYMKTYTIESTANNKKYDTSLYLNGSSFSSGSSFKIGLTNNAITITISSSTLSSGGGSSGGCVTGDTLITLADRTQKRADQITYQDELLVWDFYNGCYAVSRPSAIYNYGDDNYVVTNLHFSDGNTVKMIAEHEFFDVEANRFVYMTEDNVASFVGRSFLRVDGDGYSPVTLVGYDYTVEYTGSYTILTAVHYNCISEGMFSLTADPSYKCETFFRIFEVGENMRFDAAKMEADIRTYGLYTYEDYAAYVSYEEYVAFGGAYFKVLVGKGLLKFEDILLAVATYAP